MTGLAASLVLAAAIALPAADWEWNLTPGFPKPPVPSENPMRAAKVELGRHLFYDTRLSVNGKQSCASCHRQELAFTDGLARATGTTGERHPRSSMSLVNVAYAASLTWADPKLVALEDQALVPMFGTDPIELGLKGQEQRVLAALRSDEIYRRLFTAAFPGDSQPFRIESITRALAVFERTIVSTRSRYDRYRYGGDESALSPAAKRGERLFFSGEKTGCFQCHGGWNFSGAVRYEGGPPINVEFHNTGLYDIYREPNTGLQKRTGKAEDAGKFRVPTLRNIAVTAPYMHDGSMATLAAVIEHYAQGGRDGVYNRPMFSSGLLSSAASGSDNGVRWIIHYRLNLCRA